MILAGDDAFVTLNAGNPTVRGNAAVIAAGTGLGEAGLFWDGRAYRPFASEGGHASFAPRDDLEMGLLRFLLAECALNRTSAICAQALGLFVSLYGAEAGNLALKTRATGGVFVAGGIAPKILPALTHGTFLDSFLAKGRLQPVLASMPVRVVVSGTIALLGAARAAESHLECES